jgi:hypothetical protein
MQNLPSGKSNSVHFPDGTLAPRPTDGYIFRSFSGDEWLWNDADGKWDRHPLSTGNVHGWWQTPSSESDSGRGWRSMYFPPDSKEKEPAQLNIFEKKCECGSEKAGAFGHSTWCPKYEG